MRLRWWLAIGFVTLVLTPYAITVWLCNRGSGTHRFALHDRENKHLATVDITLPIAWWFTPDWTDWSLTVTRPATYRRVWFDDSHDPPFFVELFLGHTGELEILSPAWHRTHMVLSEGLNCEFNIDAIEGTGVWFFGPGPLVDGLMHPTTAAQPSADAHAIAP